MLIDFKDFDGLSSDEEQIRYLLNDNVELSTLVSAFDNVIQYIDVNKTLIKELADKEVEFGYNSDLGKIFRITKGEIDRYFQDTPEQTMLLEDQLS
jgi:hypothetical protein